VKVKKSRVLDGVSYTIVVDGVLVIEDTDVVLSCADVVVEQADVVGE
jgi:hypothetical protein